MIRIVMIIMIILNLLALSSKKQGPRCLRPGPVEAWGTKPKTLETSEKTSGRGQELLGFRV